MVAPIKRLASVMAKALLCINVFALTACSTMPSPSVIDAPQAAWLSEIIDYRGSLEVDHPDNINAQFEVSAPMRQLVRSKFGKYHHSVAARKLARWLIETDGHDMIYDVDANFSPREAFEYKRGNCLSFTLLLSALANELDIKIEFNEVDLPDVWEFDEENGIVLYRHVNGLYQNAQKRIVFDLAMQNYNFAYPQRIISKELALAKLHSNRAMRFMANDDIETALHYIKLAISLAPENSDLWLNLGVLFKRQDRLDRAEAAYLRGLQLDRRNALAASNLERLYRSQGRDRKANAYQKLALRARRHNPYYHFNLAKNHFQDGAFRKAKSAVRKAIKLHGNDARFYELSSRIEQRQNRYSSALRDLVKAYSITQDAGERDRYAAKAKLVNKRAKSAEQERQRVRDSLLQLESFGNG